MDEQTVNIWNEIMEEVEQTILNTIQKHTTMPTAKQIDYWHIQSAEQLYHAGWNAIFKAARLSPDIFQSIEEAIKEYDGQMKTSEEWSKEEFFTQRKIIIVDPDGWDRGNFQYSWCEEKISADEFLKRLNRSTTCLKYLKHNQKEK